MHKIEDRFLSASMVALATLLVVTLLGFQAWQVGAQGTDGVVNQGIPAKGTSGIVVNPKLNVVNNNPTNGEPNATLNGVLAETIKDDGTQVQVAAFAFETVHSTVAFSGIVGDVSKNTRELWNADRINNLDVELRCLTDNKQWTDENTKRVKITFVPFMRNNGDGTTTTDYTYSVTGRVDQHGTCALFFSNRQAPNAEAGVSEADNKVGQSNRDVNVMGIAP